MKSTGYIRAVLLIMAAMAIVAILWPDPRDVQEVVAQATYHPPAEENGND